LADTSQHQEEQIPDSCPHCGNKLSSWQQVLLKVDRALVCKNCWYRILLDVRSESKEEKESKTNKSKGEVK
jgi:DNA-directed RNA polymerase subunit RPC12/RpoP